MTRIIRSPALEDNIQEVDMTAADGPATARKLYEEGNLVLLRGRRFDLDYAFLNALDFDVDAPHEIMRKIKKYTADKILGMTADSPGAIDRIVFEKVFGGDAGRLAHYQAQVRSGNEQIVALYREVFPNYIDYKRAFTWRFTETTFENMHWDNFNTPDVFHQVRIFSNIDKTSRIWRTSHRIEAYVDSIYADQDLGRLAGGTADELNVFVNNRVLGGMASACLDGLPKTHLAFEQGDIWLCETRIVSHQIYQGAKALAAMIYVDPASMDRPELAFDARISRLHERHAARPAA